MLTQAFATPVEIPEMAVARAERHRALLGILAEKGWISIGEMARRFRVSPTTARRDAASLASEGRAARKAGELRSAPGGAGEQHFDARALVGRSVKALIARRVLPLVPEEGVVFVDGGTTCLEVGRQLLARPGLRLVTNSVPLLALSSAGRATVVSVGGEVRKASLALSGALNQSWMESLAFDAAIMGAGRMDIEAGAFTNDLHEANLKANVLRRSQVRGLVADSAKWHRSAAIHFAPWSAFSFLVTNLPPPPGAWRHLLPGRMSVLVTEPHPS